MALFNATAAKVKKRLAVNTLGLVFPGLWSRMMATAMYHPAVVLRRSTMSTPRYLGSVCLKGWLSLLMFVSAAWSGGPGNRYTWWSSSPEDCNVGPIQARALRTLCHHHIYPHPKQKPRYLGLVLSLLVPRKDSPGRCSVRWKVSKTARIAIILIDPLFMLLRANPRIVEEVEEIRIIGISG